MAYVLRRHGYLLLLAPVVIYLTVLFLWPIARVLALGFLEDGQLTLRHYAKVFTVAPYPEVLALTFRLALQVTVACLLLGYPYAYLLTQASPWARGLLMIPVLLPFFTSLLVRTYAWMVLLGRRGVLNELLQRMGLTERPLELMYNTFGVTVGMVHVLLPFMIFPLFGSMAAMDRDLLKAASSLGASPLQVFRRVFLPLTLPGVGAGCLLVFILALGFYITPALLGGPRDITISRLIAIQVNQHFDWAFASALAGVLLVATLVCVVIYQRVLGLERLFG